jgi:hypothetical protein
VLADRGVAAAIEALRAPDLPAALAPLWQAFCELNASRGSGGMGPANITYPDILAWQALSGVDLNPWEIGAIKAMDSVVIAMAYTPAKNTAKKK